MSVTIQHLKTCYPGYFQAEPGQDIVRVQIDNLTTYEQVYTALELCADADAAEITRLIAESPDKGKAPFNEAVELDRHQGPTEDECVYAYFSVRSHPPEYIDDSYAARSLVVCDDRGQALYRESTGDYANGWTADTLQAYRDAAASSEELHETDDCGQPAHGTRWRASEVAKNSPQPECARRVRTQN